MSDKRVSRRHALIYVHQDGGHWLVDFGSSNGILLNQRLIKEPVLLRHLDRLVIADSWLVYHNPSQPRVDDSADASEASEAKTERLPPMAPYLERGFVFLTPDGSIQYASEPAQRWLKDYCGPGTKNTLPPRLKDWVQQQLKPAKDSTAAKEPLIVDSESRRLIVQFERDDRQQFLVLAEHNLAETPAALQSLGLSERETEVLHWLMQGKGNSEVATILNVSLRTVEKHVEHIYEKLGVETRASAILRAFECLSQSAGEQ